MFQGIWQKEMYQKNIMLLDLKNLSGPGEEGGGEGGTEKR